MSPKETIRSTRSRPPTVLFGWTVFGGWAWAGYPRPEPARPTLIAIIRLAACGLWKDQIAGGVSAKVLANPDKLASQPNG